MLYLNNRITGEQIRLKKSSENAIYFNIFENGYCAKNDKFAIAEKIEAQRDKDFLPTDPMTEQELIEYTSFLKIRDQYDDFIFDNDPQNWLFQERPIRIILRKSFIASAIYENPLFSSVVERIREEMIDYIRIGHETIVIYCNGIDEEDYNIVAPYIESGDIILENIIEN